MARTPAPGHGHPSRAPLDQPQQTPRSRPLALLEKQTLFWKSRLFPGSSAPWNAEVSFGQEFHLISGDWTRAMEKESIKGASGSAAETGIYNSRSPGSG